MTGRFWRSLYVGRMTEYLSLEAMVAAGINAGYVNISDLSQAQLYARNEKKNDCG